MTTNTNVYEISNPSDGCTIAAERLVACVAVLILGKGMYGLRDKEGELVLPLFLFNASPDPWLRENGIDGADDLPRYIAEHEAELAAALESVLYGSFKDRERFEKVFSLIEGDEKRQEWKQSWNESRRSSMNPIVARAEHFAKALREMAESHRAG